MKTLHSLSLVAALGLASTVYAQTPTPPNPTETQPNTQTSPDTTAPDTAASPHQRSATSTTAPEAATTGSSEPSASASPHQLDAVADANVKGSMTGKHTAKWVGAKVATPTGESLGEVKEVVVDKKGNPSYAVISHGAVMGVGGKRTAVPWATVQTAMQDDKLILDRTQLEQAPVLQGSKTPDASSGTWSRDADTYWRAKVSSRSTSPATGTSPSTPAPVPAPSKQY